MGGTKFALKRCQVLGSSLRILPRQQPSWACQGGIRLQSTQTSSTMDLVPEDDYMSSGYSTLQFSVKRDIPPSVDLEPEFSRELAEKHWNALVTAAASASQPSQTLVTAHEMDLVEAASKRKCYDKILLLIKHGEDESQLGKTASDHDPALTGRGIGQTLNVSRRVATFCNDETGLLPELIVAAPLRRALDTAMLVFPHYSPESVRCIPWLCHPGLADVDVDENDESLSSSSGTNGETGQHIGSGMQQRMSLVRSKQELLSRSDDFLEWLRSRDEQVVVGKYKRSRCDD